MRSRAATKDPLIMRARFKRYVLCCLAMAALAATATASAQTRYTTIVIDPGHGGFDRGGPWEKPGVRRRGYFVLRRTTIPAVLVECGFLTNPTEAQYAQSNAYRQQLAQEIARGILNRPALAARTGYTNRSSRVDVGLQPFLDQRFGRESGTKHHRRHQTSTKKKSSSTTKKNVSSEGQ